MRETTVHRRRTIRIEPDHRAHIKPLRCDDVALINELFARLTPESRYRRFHGPKPELSSADCASLASVDRHNRVALAATGCGGRPLAVAHAFRLPEDPMVAEVAVMVADAQQRQGLGTELIRCLATWVTALGIERLVASVLSETSLPKTLVRHGWQVTEHNGIVITLAIDALCVAHLPETESVLYPIRSNPSPRVS